MRRGRALFAETEPMEVVFNTGLAALASHLDRVMQGVLDEALCWHVQRLRPRYQHSGRSLRRTAR
jgi:hypothetical protein